jgi:hypothetical protein
VLRIHKVVIVREAVAEISYGSLSVQAANSVFVDDYDQVPLRLPKMQNHQSLRLCWGSSSRWCKESGACSVGYKGSRYIDDKQEWLSHILMI